MNSIEKPLNWSEGGTEIASHLLTETRLGYIHSTELQTPPSSCQSSELLLGGESSTEIA